MRVFLAHSLKLRFFTALLKKKKKKNKKKNKKATLSVVCKRYIFHFLFLCSFLSSVWILVRTNFYFFVTKKSLFWLVWVFLAHSLKLRFFTTLLKKKIKKGHDYQQRQSDFMHSTIQDKDKKPVKKVNIMTLRATTTFHKPDWLSNMSHIIHKCNGPCHIQLIAISHTFTVFLLFLTIKETIKSS